MDILFAVVADELVDVDGEKHDIIGALHTILCDDFPAERVVQLWIGFRANPLSMDFMPDVRIGYLNPNGDGSDFPANPDLESASTFITKKTPLVLYHMSLAIPLVCPGIHLFEIYVNDELRQVVSLDVRRVE